MLLADDLDDDCTGPRPVVELTPGQYQTRVAYRIDPLLAQCVLIVDPAWPTRIDGEVDASSLWRDRFTEV